MEPIKHSVDKYTWLDRGPNIMVLVQMPSTNSASEADMEPEVACHFSTHGFEVVISECWKPGSEANALTDHVAIPRKLECHVLRLQNLFEDLRPEFCFGKVIVQPQVGRFRTLANISTGNCVEVRLAKADPLKSWPQLLKDLSAENR
jgi:hypothetical protein